MHKTQKHHPLMADFPEPTTVFQANLQRLIRPNGKDISVNQWAKAHKLDQSTINRLVNGQEPKLSMILAIAEKADLEPWALLVPGLDPRNPPVLKESSESEKRLWNKIENLHQQLEEIRGMGSTGHGELK